MFKKLIRSMSLILIFVILLVSVPLSVTAQEDPFLVGTCCHNMSIKSYGNNLEEFVYYNAKMGSKIIRIDMGISSAEGYDYWDKFFALCEAYKLEVMGIVYSAEQAEIFASRYGKQIKFMQMLNEQDTPCFVGNDGKSKADFNINKIAEVVAQLNEISAVMREYSPNTKLIVNCAFVHYGYFMHLIEQGVDFDIIGMDWYSHCDYYGFEKMLDELAELGKPIFMCEANIWQHDTDKREEMGAKIIDYIEICKRKQKTNNIIGLTIYEMLDEPQKSDGEERFGLIEMNEDFTIKGPKSAYYEVQEYLGFKNKNVKRVSLSSLELDKYGPNPFEENSNESSSNSSQITSQESSQNSSQNSSQVTSQETSQSSSQTNSEVSSDSVNNSEESTVSTPEIIKQTEIITEYVTEVVTDVSEVVDVVETEPDVVESIVTKNVYVKKGLPIWLIIEIVGCLVITITVALFFILKKKSHKKSIKE